MSEQFKMSEDGYTIDRLLKETIRQADAIRILEDGLKYYDDTDSWICAIESCTGIHCEHGEHLHLPDNAVDVRLGGRYAAAEALAQAKAAMEGK